MKPIVAFALALGVGLGISSSALAQLNETCTVSILNRTARVDPNGDWLLPNVPANLGQVRMRATCVENGLTLSGQTDFFTIPENGAVHVHVGESDLRKLTCTNVATLYDFDLALVEKPSPLIAAG